MADRHDFTTTKTNGNKVETVTVNSNGGNHATLADVIRTVIPVYPNVPGSTETRTIRSEGRFFETTTINGVDTSTYSEARGGKIYTYELSTDKTTGKTTATYTESDSLYPSRNDAGVIGRDAKKQNISPTLCADRIRGGAELILDDNEKARKAMPATLGNQLENFVSPHLRGKGFVDLPGGANDLPTNSSVAKTSKGVGVTPEGRH